MAVSCSDGTEQPEADSGYPRSLPSEAVEAITVNPGFFSPPPLNTVAGRQEDVTSTAHLLSRASVIVVFR